MWFCCLFGGLSETIFFCDALSGCCGCDCALHSLLEICLVCCQLRGFHGAGFGADWSPLVLFVDCVLSSLIKMVDGLKAGSPTCFCLGDSRV